METRFVLLALLGASSYGQTGTFTPTGNMITPRFGHNATLLPNGKVLITGGNTVCYFGIGFPGGPSCLQPDRAELYDPATGTFTLTGGMSTAYPNPVLLPNGKVLFAGHDNAEMMTTLKLYDPSTGDLSTAAKPATLTSVDSATLLSDGRVLLIGGVYGAELYDPASETFSPIANWPGRQSWSPIALADGTVLLVYSFDYESESGRYDPATNAFRATGSFAYYVRLPLPTLLPNGNVLFTGGVTDFGNDKRAELYDPATGTFASTGSMSTYRNRQSATLLPNGTVLVAGGAGQSANSQPPLGGAEIYDPATRGFSTTGNLTSSRYGHTATLLNNGQVLITGGSASSFNFPVSDGSISSLSSAELYTPAVVVPAPALFSLSGDGTGQGAIWHAQTGQIASAGNPAVAGEALSMYTTSLADGSVIPPQVVVGGRVAQVLYYGTAPGYSGYNQVNFLMPRGVPRGPAVPIRLTYIGRSSNAVTVGVQ